MNNGYNLSDNVNDTFPFEANGLKYAMRYPLISEVDKIQELNNKINEASEIPKDADAETKEKIKAEVQKLGDEMETYIYSFIEPVGHETPIKETLEKVNVRVLRNFNVMVKKELAIS